MVTNAASPAAEAYGPTILARLAPAERAALDRYAARALGDPDAAPEGEEEVAAEARVHALIAARWRDWRPRRG